MNNYYDEPRDGNRDGGFDSMSGQADRDQQGLDNADYTTSQNDDLEPQVDQADDVNVSDDSGSFDDASLGDSDSDDSSFV